MHKAFAVAKGVVSTPEPICLGEDEVDLAKKGAQKVACKAVKKISEKAGKRVCGHTGGVIGAAVGTAAAFVTETEQKDIPKEGAKMAVGFVAGTGIDYAVKYIVTFTAKTAASAGAAEGTKIGMRLAAAQGANAATKGGFAALGAELAGGFIGKRVGRTLAQRLATNDSQVHDRGARFGEDVGALTGSVGVGAALGAVYVGPVGAVGGAGLGAAGWGIGKVTEVAVDQAAGFQGISIIRPRLDVGSTSTCTQDHAAACIVTEESPGLGICRIYFYLTEQEAKEHFDEWWVSRTLYRMQEARLVAELQRGGWPWNQANIAKASHDLWAEFVLFPQVAYTWTARGVASTRQFGVFEFLGRPKAGDRITDDQVEAFALGETSVEELAARGHLHATK